MDTGPLSAGLLPPLHPSHLGALGRRVLLESRGAGAVVCPLTGSALEVGAWDVPPSGLTAVRRAGGGRPMFAGAGVVVGMLRVPRAGDGPERVVARVARGLLGWLKGMRVPVAYFGRDALTVGGFEPVRFSLTGTGDAFLVDIRVGLEVPLDHPALPVPTGANPGEQKPSRALVASSRHVATGEAFLAGLLQALGIGLAVAVPEGGDDVVHGVQPAGGVMAPIGRVWLHEGRLTGPFHASRGLVDDVAAGLLPSDALAKPGAFIWGADAGDLQAALEHR